MIERTLPVLLLLSQLIIETWALTPGVSDYPEGSSSNGRKSSVPVTDSGSQTLYLGFQEAYAQATPFFDSAEKAKIKIQPEELAVRLAVYAELYPGQPITSRRVEKLLKAEKYLAAHGKSASEVDVEARLVAMKSMGRSFNTVEKEALKQAIQSELLFKEKEIRKLGEKSVDLSFLRNQEVMKDSWTLWPSENLRLHGTPNDCLVSLDDQCRIVVEEFNAALGEYPVPRVLDRDSARAVVLRKYLVDIQLANSVPFPDSGIQVDSLIDAMKIRVLPASVWKS